MFDKVTFALTVQLMNVKQFYIFMYGVFMRLIFFLCCTVLLVSVSIASAEPYAGLAGGLSVVHASNLVQGDARYNCSYDSGIAASVTGGYRMDKQRFDLTYGYKSVSIKSKTINGTRTEMQDADLTVSSLMANYYMEFYDTPVVPLIGIGIGLLYGDMKTTAFGVSGLTMGTQLTTGATYHLNKNIDLDVTYQFLFANSNIRSNRDEFSYSSSNISGGIRYYFK